MLPQQTLTSRRNAALAAFPRPWCGQLVTPGWWSRSLSDSPLSPAGFPVSALGFDGTAFDLWLQPLDLGRFILTDFQPLTCLDFLISN